MAELKVFHDRDGKTLIVWFGDPRNEYVCEETGEEVVLMKDTAGADTVDEARRRLLARKVCQLQERMPESEVRFP